MVTCLLFGEVKFLCGCSSIDVNISGDICSASLWAAVVAAVHCQARFKERVRDVLTSCALAVDDEIVEKDDLICVNSKTLLAVIPPISGG